MNELDTIVEALKAHTWWLAGNLGIPGMPDRTVCKCMCGWSGDDPHAHQAEVVIDALERQNQRWCSYCNGSGIVPGSEEQTWVKGIGWTVVKP